ncbi:SpoVT/AbrB domain protein [Pyrobaculum ferrireducens]|uniref:SpoVT/AbrB domain protein n=1 Tax=Pyrobaculum ferrireducens TaxID=1104324 RepID=G7VHM0_9CREN|nr:SpoVT/AbrB domain protein [Pyrobaculum ferrireducens]
MQKIKTGSYIISLPMDWVLKNRLKPKDPLLVFEDPNNNIVVKIPMSRCNLTLDAGIYEDPELLEEVVKYLYIFGVDQITVTGHNQGVLKRLRELRKDLIGYEIDDFTNGRVVISIKDDIHALEERHLKRVWEKYLKLLGDILDGICSYRNDEELRDKIVESKRLVRHLQRLLSIALKEPERNKIPYPTFAAFFETTIRLREVGYYIYRMVDFLAGVRQREELDAMCRLCKEALNTSDLKRLVEIRERINTLEEASLPKLNAYEAHMAFAMRRIVFNLVRISELMTVAAAAQRTVCTPASREEEEF